MLFRSEESIEHWCSHNHIARGESLSVAQVWELSRAWYHNRLSPDYHGRTTNQAEAIFKQLGLIAPFWYTDG